MSEFVTVAAADEIQPGERIVVELGSLWVVVFRVGGQYFALEDMCTHEEYYLSEGALDGYSVECAKHGAQFDIRSGAVLAPPALRPVKWFATRIVGNELQVEQP